MGNTSETSSTSKPKKKKRGRHRRRERSLQGTHLYRDTRTTILWWRRTDPVTGERIRKSTGSKVLEYALKKAQEFDDELERRAVGIKTYDSWTLPLEPLVKEWFADTRAQDRPPQEKWLRQKERFIAHALDVLKLRKAADLTNVGKLDQRLKALRKPDATLRRRFQDPLKQFSAWLAENGRYLERDPLSVWKTIQYESESIHRAFGPEEVARALVASDWLDVIHHRQHKLRIAFELLLIAAPRLSAFATRDAVHYLREERRLDMGAGKGKKLRGQAKLDDTTAAALEAYLGDRTEGPLVYSPRGGRLDKRNLLRWWREAFGLGVVWELWPEGEDWDVNLAHMVNTTLLSKSGKARVSSFGNPNLVKPETKRARRTLAARVQVLADELRPQWDHRMERVTVHSFRHTHQTWARAVGVDQVLVNLQVGWKASAMADELEGLRAVSSITGLARYLDARSSLLDARRTAVAVRELLDEAFTAIAIPVDNARPAEVARG
ncbi:MAG: hypothetical protein AB7G23_20405 [Vicinamibacterales bacterium]